MKKIIAFSLCLVLIFSLSVCSFGATPTNLEATISHDLAMVLSIVDAYLPKLQEIETDVNDISGNLVVLHDYLQSVLTNTGLWQTRIETLLNKLNTFIQQDFFDLVDFRAGEIISAIGGTTRAIGLFQSSLEQQLDHQLFDLQSPDSLGYMIYMLQQVLADEDDLAFKQKNKNNEKAVIDFAETPSSNGNISYLNSITSSIDSFGYLSDMISIDYDLAETFEYIHDNLTSSDPWMWFTEANKNEINGASSSTLSTRGISDCSDDVEIVTDYLGENKRKLFEFLQERDS